MNEHSHKLEAGVLIAAALAVLFSAMLNQIVAIIIAIAALMLVGIYNFFRDSQL